MSSPLDVPCRSCPAQPNEPCDEEGRVHLGRGVCVPGVDHEAIARNDEAWLDQTFARATQNIPGVVSLEYGTCKWCLSTLARPLREDLGVGKGGACR